MQRSTPFWGGSRAGILRLTPLWRGWAWGRSPSPPSCRAAPWADAQPSTSPWKRQTGAQPILPSLRGWHGGQRSGLLSRDRCMQPPGARGRLGWAPRAFPPAPAQPGQPRRPAWLQHPSPGRESWHWCCTPFPPSGRPRPTHLAEPVPRGTPPPASRAWDPGGGLWAPARQAWGCRGAAAPAAGCRMRGTICAASAVLSRSLAPGTAGPLPACPPPRAAGPAAGALQATGGSPRPPAHRRSSPARRCLFSCWQPSSRRRRRCRRRPWAMGRRRGWSRLQVRGGRRPGRSARR